jgi:hypothetical protein
VKVYSQPLPRAGPTGRMVDGTLTQSFVRRGRLHPWAFLVFSLPGERKSPGAGDWLLWSPILASPHRTRPKE